MFDSILDPWPWYVTGPLIGLTVPLLLLLSNKALGISSTFQNLCVTVFSTFTPKLRNDAGNRKESWKIIFAIGLILGGFIVAHFLSRVPIFLFPESYHSLSGAAKLLAGGFLIGFGTRYAEGCTSGHAIFGLSSLQLASLVAVLGFFAGGLVAAAITLLLR